MSNDIAFEERVELVAKDHAEMVRRLATAFAIPDDVALRRRLEQHAGVSPGSPFQVSWQKGYAYIAIDGATISARRSTLSGASLIDLDVLLDQDTLTTELFNRALAHGPALDRARQLLDPLFDGPLLLSRSQFEGIQRWAPLIEQLSYRCATRISDLVDVMRPEIKRKTRRRRRSPCALGGILELYSHDGPPDIGIL